MEQFSIITGTKEMQNTLLENVKSEVGNEVAVEVDENSVILKSKDEISKEKLIGAITNSIVEQYGNKLISRLINQNYCYFNLPDKKSIFNKALDYAYKEASCNTLVSAKLKEYLSTTDSVMIDGFVNFRLRDYQSELEDLIDKAVSDFMIEKEYKEFIALLKYFVEIQNPKFNVINIVPYSGGYSVYNEIKDNITAVCVQDFIKEEEADKINSDDLLISVLITIAPRKIYLHKSERIENAELLSTITQVFHKRTIFCDGCEFCNRL